MKTPAPIRPNLLKIIQENYYNKQKQIRSGGIPSSLKSKINMSFPSIESRSGSVNPYLYSIHPESNVQGFGFGIQGNQDIGRFNLSGGIESNYMPNQGMANPMFNAGVGYRFNNGGIYLSDRAKATQFGQYKRGGGYFPPYHSYAPPRMEDGGPGDGYVDAKFPIPYSHEFVDKYQEDYNNFYAQRPKYSYDDGFDEYIHTKKGKAPFNTVIQEDAGPTWEYKGEIMHKSSFPSQWQRKIDKGKATKEDFKYYPNYIQNKNIGPFQLDRLVHYVGSEAKKSPSLFFNYGGDISIPDLQEDELDMYELAGPVKPGSGGFPQVSSAYLPPSVRAQMLKSSPSQVSSQYVPKGIMAPAASESTSRSFYNPMLGRQTSTATTGVSSANMARTSADMSKGKRTAERERMKKINESNQAIAAKDEGTPFTLPNGQTKTYDQMNAREKAYVSGSALKNRFKIFPNEDSYVDKFLNPFNFVLGRVAGNLGTAPYEAKESDSVVPYLTSVGEPLALGAIAHVADPQGSMESWAKELMNPVPGLFKKHATNVGEKVGIGAIAAKNLATTAKHKAIEEGRTELIQHGREHATEHGAESEHRMGGGIYAYGHGGSIVNYLASTGRNFDKATRKKMAEARGLKGYSGTPEENTKLLNMIIDEDAASMKSPRQGVPYADAGKRQMPQQPIFNAPIFGVPQQVPVAKKSAAPVAKKVASSQKAATPVVGTDSGFRPYSLENNWQYNIPGVTTSTAPSKQPKTAKQAAKQKERQANNERAQTNLSPTASVTSGDPRNLESGMITDKGTNMMHVIKNGKIVNSFPVLTGQARNVNANPYTVNQLGRNPNLRGTPVGTYFSNPTKKNLYGDKGFWMNPIPAFGQAAPAARSLAQHVTFGKEEDPAEYRRRESLYGKSPAARATSYGCTNCRKPDLDYIVNAFPQGDTTMVIDSRNPKDAQLLNTKFKKKKHGGEPGYSGTYSAGVYYGQGGSFVPEFYSPEYGLPQFMYGVGMEQGGLVKGGEYDMTEEEIQNLIDQGYKIQYI